MMFGAMSGSPEPEGFVHTFDTDDRFEDGWENLSGSGWAGGGSWTATNNSIGKRFASPLKAGTKIRVNTSVVTSPYGCNQGAGLSPSGSEGNNSTSIFAQVGLPGSEDLGFHHFGLDGFLRGRLRSLLGQRPDVVHVQADMPEPALVLRVLRPLDLPVHMVI